MPRTYALAVYVPELVRFRGVEGFRTVFPGRLSQLPQSSFAMLADLLDPHPPGMAPIALSVGDPRGTMPAFVMEALNSHAHQFGEYPPINGTKAWRDAAAGWIKRRFGVEVDPEREVLPLNGTREGLFLAPFIVTPETKAGARPVILLPNPFYQCYAAAILSAGAEPVFVRARRGERLSCPTMRRFRRQMLERTVAAYICSPSNPEGAVASEAVLAGHCSRSPTATISRCSPTSAMPTSIWASRRSAR